MIIRKNSKSKVEGSFGGHENLAIFWKHYFPQKRLPQNVWSLKNFLSPRKCFHGWKSCFLLEALFSTKKTASKCVINRKHSKSQVGGSFGVWENLAFCWKHYFQQKRLPQNVWSSEKILSPREKEFLVAGNILLSVGSIISHKKDSHKCVIIRKNYKSLGGGIFGGWNILLSVGSIISHKKDCHICVIIRKKF